MIRTALIIKYKTTMTEFFQSMVIFTILLSQNNVHSESRQQYMSRRLINFESEQNEFLGSNITLSKFETLANVKLMNMKNLEFNVSKGKDRFPPAHHFFIAKDWIEQSAIFDVIRKMPKGAALHLHDSSLVDVKWLVKEASYTNTDYLYVCTDKTGQLYLTFSYEKPKHTHAGIKPEGCSWKLLKKLRDKHGAQLVDDWLLGNFSLQVKNPWHEYPNQDVVWDKFYSLFTAADGLIFFVDVFKRYFVEAIHQFYVDNVQYFEFRALLHQAYELDGSIHKEEWLMETYMNISKEFSRMYPDFYGTRLIYSTSRTQRNISEALKKAYILRSQFQNYMLGFDLVGHEDPGRTLLQHLDALLPPSQQPNPMRYFFHAGETDWEGMGADENLMDALLLNTSRVGHGYAITKHPQVMRLARQHQVAVEVCPISNQVLKLVDDLRNHPAAALMAVDFPLVISSDDPGLWGTRGLSYDWYMAFMGLGGAHADLRFLKQLAINSIRYSGLQEGEKKKLFEIWEKKWDLFIQDFLQAQA